jgi:hypothetical protein
LTAAQSVKVTIGGCGWTNPKNKNKYQRKVKWEKENH